MTDTQPDSATPMIRLDGVSMTYPGGDRPAVDNLDLDISKGEILVLVGPSGCGKSTTLRLINRMIEPTQGRIYFDGEDVTDVDVDKLRRRIGYVIQQVGLFPHNTIAQNVATVPKLLGWDKEETAERTDELLNLMGLDPNEYRDRYPKELSGGQAQRVGVARALAGDPAVLLMDEPFGAIDPINRDRIQNEFLRLQAELKKTIVFVTHDIDEAIKMGDRIAILGEGSRIAQLDSPDRILAYPVDDFVSDFIGEGSSLKGLNFERVRDIELSDVPRIASTATREEAVTTLSESDEKWLLVLDEQNRPKRWVGSKHLKRAEGPLLEIGIPAQAIVEPIATLRDALDEMLDSNAGQVIVVDTDGSYTGVVDLEALISSIRRMRSDAKEHYEKLHLTGESPVVPPGGVVSP